MSSFPISIRIVNSPAGEPAGVRLRYWLIPGLAVDVSASIRSSIPIGFAVSALHAEVEYIVTAVIS